MHGEGYGYERHCSEQAAVKPCNSGHGKVVRCVVYDGGYDDAAGENHGDYTGNGGKFQVGQITKEAKGEQHAAAYNERD